CRYQGLWAIQRGRGQWLTLAPVGIEAIWTPLFIKEADSTQSNNNVFRSIHPLTLAIAKNVI
ncbi:MAG: hypothetical protein AAF959_27830, partial [Cyanobacteria bacterium P01_D01_bin.56]